MSRTPSAPQGGWSLACWEESHRGMQPRMEKSLAKATGEKLMGKSTDGAALLPLAFLPERLCFEVKRYFPGEPKS